MKRKKIKLLSPSETKRITVDSGVQSGTGSGSGSGCSLNQTCANHASIQCSGVKCSAHYETIMDKPYLKSIECIDANGIATMHPCDNSMVASGSSEERARAACKSLPEGASCSWYEDNDGIFKRYGKCISEHWGNGKICSDGKPLKSDDKKKL